MSEFSSSDLKKWLELAVLNDCSIYKAIRYIYFFDYDREKAMRAYRYFLHQNGIEPSEGEN